MISSKLVNNIRLRELNLSQFNTSANGHVWCCGNPCVASDECTVETGQAISLKYLLFNSMEMETWAPNLNLFGVRWNINLDLIIKLTRCSMESNCKFN